MKHLKLLWRVETGLELSEYAVSAALIIVPIAVGFTSLGNHIAAVMDRIASFIAT
jgi:Flp pilus assembly pilin Flp